MNPLDELMKDLGVKTYKELFEYMNDEAHKNDPLVKEFKEFFNYFLEKEAEKNEE